MWERTKSMCCVLSAFFFLVSLNTCGCMCTYMHTPLYKCIHTPKNKGQHFCSAFALSLFRMEDNIAPFFRNTPSEFTHSQHSALRQQIILNKLFNGLSSLWLTQSFRKKYIKNYGTYKILNLRTIATCNVLKCDLRSSWVLLLLNLIHNVHVVMCLGPGI